MPRKRTPSPEQQKQDRQIVAGAAIVIRAVGERYDNGLLLGVVQLLDSYGNDPIAIPTSRTRKPKAQPHDLVSSVQAEGSLNRLTSVAGLGKA